jgi:hypothetical protein
MNNLILNLGIVAMIIAVISCALFVLGVSKDKELMFNIGVGGYILTMCIIVIMVIL